MSVEEITSFLPYKFNGEKYHTVSALVEALLRIPCKGINELKNGKLTQHFGYFDPVTETSCLNAEKSICDNENENYGIFFRLMYQLNPSEKRIFCGTNEYSDISDLARDCITESTAIISKDSNNEVSEFISHLLLMLESGFLEDYVRNFNKIEIINSISNCNLILSDGKFNYTPAQKTLIFGYYLCSCRKLVIQEKLFESPEEFYNEMKIFQKNDAINYPKYIKDIKNELEFYLNVLPDESSIGFIQKIYDDLMTAIFGDYEYVFKNGDDFNQFIDKLIEDRKLYEVESLLDRYYLALQDVSREIWKNNACERLSNIVDKFIHFGEFIFKDKEDIKQFIDTMLTNHKHNPLYLKRFVTTYDGFITTLEKKDKEFIDIFSALKRLNLEQEVIELDEYLFISEEEFVDFLNRLKLEHPLKIKDFVKLHKYALLKLSRPGRLKCLIDNILAIENVNAPSSSIFLDNKTFYSFPIKGQCIKFGKYWFDNSGEKAPIEWFVLNTWGNEVELVSKYGLDYKKEKEEGGALSEWLEGFFLDEAFSQNERNMIVLVSVPSRNIAKQDKDISICKPTPYTKGLIEKVSSYGRRLEYFASLHPRYDSEDECMRLDMIDERGRYLNGLLGPAMVRPLITIKIGSKKTR